jgi:serine protease Do
MARIGSVTASHIARPRALLAFGPALYFAFALPAAAQQMNMMPPDRAALLHSLLPTVVNIHAQIGAPVTEAAQNATSNQVAGASTPSLPSSVNGSGFVIDPAGYIVTNDHVVAGAYEITVMFSDGSVTNADLVGEVNAIDIAVIKVDVGHPLTAVQWGNSDTVQIGDAVFAVGNALGLGTSVTSGIVSALNRDIMDTPYDDFIQTDASINHGNSGGPLFNRDGLVIGMDTAIISPTTGSVGLGFAIPANDTRYIATQLEKFGHTRPGYLGIKVEQVTSEMANALNMAKPEGSIVAFVSAKGPAERAGLRVGDVITNYNNKNPTDERALLRDIAQTSVGATVPVVLLRGGDTMTVNVTVADWPTTLWDKLHPQEKTAPPRVDVPPNLGLSLQPASFDDVRAQYGLSMQQTGVVITGVAANTDAARRGLAAGDVLLRVQDTEVRTPADVLAVLDQARAQKRSFVIALVMSKKAEPSGRKWMALRVSPLPVLAHSQ